MYVKRNIETRLCNHCCGGKGVIIAYCEYVVVGSGIHCEKRLLHTAICGLSSGILTCICLRAGGLLVKFPPTVDVITRMRNT